jgi:hypothetical protein
MAATTLVEVSAGGFSDCLRDREVSKGPVKKRSLPKAGAARG